MFLNVDKNTKIVIESELSANVRCLAPMNVSSRIWSPLHFTQINAYFLVMNSKRCSMLYIEHTNDFFCFPLSKSLISMLYKEHTNEKIEHTNEYIEHGYGYGLPSPLMTSIMNPVSQ